MGAYEISLGRALAWLHMRNGDGQSEDSAGPEQDLLVQVRARSGVFKGAAVQEKEFRELLEHECLTEPQSAEKTIDFYLALFDGGNGKLAAGYSEELIQSLNDHYHFFERFAEVMRGYHRAVEELGDDGK